MARGRPFFGSGPAPQIARMDMQSATAPGRMYANALQNFGTAIANGIEKYRAKKEKKEQQETTYTALKQAGFDDEIAKAGSKDPSVITSTLGLKNFQLQEKKAEQLGDFYEAKTAEMGKKSPSEIRAEREEEMEEVANHEFFNKANDDGVTLAETKFPNIPKELFPTGEKPFGFYGAFMKNLDGFSKATENVQDVFTENGGDFTKLVSGSEEEKKTEIATWIKSGGKPSDINNFLEGGMRLEEGAFNPEPISIDFNKDGSPDVYGLPNKRGGEFRYFDAPTLPQDGDEEGVKMATFRAENDIMENALKPNATLQEMRMAMRLYSNKDRVDPLTGKSGLSPFYRTALSDLQRRYKALEGKSNQ